MRFQYGQVAERLNAPVSKTGIPFGVSWVRIPPCPLDCPRRRRSWLRRYTDIGMSHLAIAAGTPFAAQTATAIADEGGNAVDAAIAATFMTWVCEPGMTSLGGGGFCCVWPPDGPPITIDGFVEMPGRSADKRRFGQGDRVSMPYGGGVDTFIGPGSIATPGALAAIELLWKKWGSLPWRELIEPAIAAARDGFPLPPQSALYFSQSYDAVFSYTPGARHLALRDDGQPRDVGDTLQIPELADSLQRIADEGADALYHGELGRAIADWVDQHDGLLGIDDLAEYAAVIRPCRMSEQRGWRMATNPAPAVGGAVLVELVSLLGERPRGRWSADDVALFARAMERAFTDRNEWLRNGQLERMSDDEFLDAVDGQRRALASPSTSHTSAIDSDGLACAVTTSTGYSAGVVVPGTGVLLNNMLGEIELNPAGLHALEPGARMRSNMAPSILRSAADDIVSFGTGGADRITSALAQVWVNVVSLEMPLEESISHPRCHVEWRDGQPILAHEPGVDTSAVPFATRGFDDLHMYFGGVQAVQRTSQGELLAVADPRRSGGAIVT